MSFTQRRPLMSDAQFRALGIAERAGKVLRGTDCLLSTLLSLNRSVVRGRRRAPWVTLERQATADDGLPAGAITGGAITTAGRSALSAERDRREQVERAVRSRATITTRVDPLTVVGYRASPIPF